ncbi:hypothetical protein GS928_24920 [Rhodococcus hoagii]|nr:hypothetical protein [Prescottella equi]
MSLPTLMHYAETQRSLDRERDYQTVRRDKPDGLWVSILGEDDWPSWCRENEFREHTLEVAHEVRLAADANVLLVNGPREFDEFDAKYRTADSRKFNEFIDWPRVESEYDGSSSPPTFGLAVRARSGTTAGIARPVSSGIYVRSSRFCPSPRR